MSKWMKVDPATLKVGDEVRWVVEITGGRVIREVVVSEVCPRSIRLGLTYIAPGNGTWYVRKPKKAKPELSPTEKAWFTMPTISEPYTPPFPPPTRPDEPPVGSFFRVDRTGREFYRYPQVSLTHYFHLACDAGDRPWVAWADVTEPGDTITRLYLREVPND